jgi:cytochrome c553
MDFRRWLGGLVCIVAAAAGEAGAAPVVAGFERFGRDAVGEAERIESGLLLLGELGCTGCHAAPGQHVAAKQSPILDGVGERLAPEWLREYLADPQRVHAGTTMPDVLAGLPEDRRGRAVTGLVHFLASGGGFDQGGLPEGEKASPKTGAQVFARAGCAACHGPLGGTPAPLGDQRPLAGLDRKWSARGLDAFLKNPLAVRPAGRMPPLSLSDQDRRHVVAALLGQQPGGAAAEKPRGAVAFTGRAWHTAVERLPAIDTLGPPVRSGPVKGFDVVALANASDNFVVELRGFFHAGQAGRYGFLTTSDDGSRVFVGDQLVVENDGIHPEQTREGRIELAAGVHPVRIEYFEAGGGEALDVEVIPPRGPRRSLLTLVTPESAGQPLAPLPAADADPGFVVDPALAAEGRATFLSAGCAGCHSRSGDDGKPLVATAPRPRGLAELAAVDAGCLAAGPPRPGIPRYALDDAQRAAVAAALGWLRSPAAAEPPDRGRAIDRTLTAMNCLACHERDGKGGVLPPAGTRDEDGEEVARDARRDALFTSPVAEIGDEGRLPPTLTAVGDKLAPAFLREVLAKGGGDRAATMHTLMPRWPAAVAEPLAKLLEGDVVTHVSAPPLAGLSDTGVHDAARALVGSKGLGCIKCHSFGGERGQSWGAIDMRRMPKRLRHEWFLAYTLDPQRFRRGTRMPAAWPEGKAFFPEAVDGTAAGQIEAIWRYLAGDKVSPPVGVGNNPIELVPAGRPIVYRNFIEGAGPRAIAVGYPEGVSIAWDADALRLALAWRGAFIDAGRHWTGRGVGFQPPLGDGVFAPDVATPLAVFAADSAIAAAAWPAGSARRADGPAADQRFTGYRLDAAGRPVFRWRWREADVEERIEPAAGGRIVRTLTLSGRPPEGSAAVRIAVGGRIESAADGWFVVDGAWRVRLPAADAARLVKREADGRVELRLPLEWKPGRPGEAARAVVTEELAW